MYWLEQRQVNERLQMVAAYLDGESSLSELARRFAVSRKTAHKWVARYQAEGPNGLLDRSRAPRANSRSPSDAMVKRIVDARRAHPDWGPRKLRAWLVRDDPSVELPATNTVGSILKRYGLVSPRKRRRRTPPYEVPFRDCDRPNAIWCADFKGHFKMRNGVRCHPLTISDAYSRYLLVCVGSRARRWRRHESSLNKRS